MAGLFEDPELDDDTLAITLSDGADEVDLYGVGALPKLTRKSPESMVWRKKTRISIRSATFLRKRTKNCEMVQLRS
ncbi:hypothetical protein [Corynebacterium parakroppenstedtii]|uniref:Uncharacterized protein n=1 Tax=Corynebacterium parakroppenstedtii TaxID=2828363 RepID=A0ABS9HLA7_9CORY|nr:hypothetical protein [Corynebacterium parakroppenstedtii]UWY22355.1 hypothetical protein N2K96_01605 [Corynebacterium kroppenstedtii]MBY0789362.1 hypothetical protein [Corynebacterium parakroppenstedtii]MCF6774594.1 hypothetical protein [Corynebacterium parakroppenstedtii]MCF6785757.1 hypothetical protein [Corynebacterium parakroppenstedtii]MCF6820817.1 hypothetical protein [Corynebacterium parakroppenstedtii]